MSEAPQQEASHCDMDHGLGDIEALFVGSDHAAPAGGPGEGALDHPAPVAGLHGHSVQVAGVAGKRRGVSARSRCRPSS